MKIIKPPFLLCLVLFLGYGCTHKKNVESQTEITKWQYDRQGAVSITYDDGSINQFRKAMPIMDRLGLKGTFFIITGQIPESQFQGRFIGRPVTTIIEETAKVSTDSTNFFERSSAAGFLGYKGTVMYHSSAGAAYDAGRDAEAFSIIDELYRKVRAGDFEPGYQPSNEAIEAIGTTWDHIRSYAKQGHEFASHTVTHPRLAALDEENLLYELEKSKDDILNQLGLEHTFSAEGPYGTENERVMEYAYKIYPALRNRMPEPYLEEINRSSKVVPSTSNKEYVQWQRGATTKTDMPLMKSWVDTVSKNDNNWLVLVFHGVDGIGWESLTSAQLEEYFQYIKEREDKLWIATFKEVTKYMRQRMNASVQAFERNGELIVKVTHTLDQTNYNIPLTLKTYVPSGWENSRVSQGEDNKSVISGKDEKGVYILYQVNPNSTEVRIAKG